MRQTTVSAETLEFYAPALAEYDPASVERVLLRLGRSPRGEYEKAVPELGELEAMVKQEEKSQRPKFIACNQTINGYQCVNGLVRVNDKGQPWRDSIDAKTSDSFARECDCKKAWRKQA